MDFSNLLKAFKENFSASIAAVMILGIFGLCGYIVQLHSERIRAQSACFEQVSACEEFWRQRVDSIQRAELLKTQRQIEQLNMIIKKMKK